MPLTHYERTKKFASSEYGTTTQRLSGHSQYQLGDCALSLTPLNQETTALVTPSGYLYQRDALLEYLLTQTRDLKEKKEAYDRQVQERLDSDASRKRAATEEAASELFHEGQSVLSNNKKSKAFSSAEAQRQAKLQELQRTSYWLADSQTVAHRETLPPPPDRPLSPNTQQPLRRKDVWSVRLRRDGNDDGGDEDGGAKSAQSSSTSSSPPPLVCALSHKPLRRGDATAYWVDKKGQDGTLVLASVYNDLVQPEGRCPLTGKRIRETRHLQGSGSSFAKSGQQVQVKKYAPTIT